MAEPIIKTKEAPECLCQCHRLPYFPTSCCYIKSDEDLVKISVWCVLAGGITCYMFLCHQSLSAAWFVLYVFKSWSRAFPLVVHQNFPHLKETNEEWLMRTFMVDYIPSCCLPDSITPADLPPLFWLFHSPLFPFSLPKLLFGRALFSPVIREFARLRSDKTLCPLWLSAALSFSWGTNARSWVWSDLRQQQLWLVYC